MYESDNSSHEVGSPLSIEEMKEDVYYSANWANLDRHLRAGEVFEFSYESGEKWYLDISIKRPIQKISGEPVQADLYDLETPYGFGGPITNSTDPSFLNEAVQAHKNRCKKEDVVAEFLRFHPFNPFPVNHSIQLDFCAQERNTVNIPLESSLEDIFMSFKSSLRRNIRKALKVDMEFVESDKKEKDQVKFMDLYYQTMENKGTDSFYFFPESYFKELFSFSFTRLFLLKWEGEVINGLLLLDTGQFLYYHLGATDARYYHLNSNPFNFYKCIEMFANGARRGLFLGGGNSISEEDSLFKFKRKFSSDVWPFYIGGLVHRQEDYDELIQRWEVLNPGDERKRFLKYRF